MVLNTRLASEYRCDTRQWTTSQPATVTCEHSNQIVFIGETLGFNYLLLQHFILITGTSFSACYFQV